MAEVYRTCLERGVTVDRFGVTLASLDDLTPLLRRLAERRPHSNDKHAGQEECDAI